MNFQNLVVIEKPDFYFDIAFSRAKKKADLLREKGLTGDRIQKSRTIELAKIEVIRGVLVDRFLQILTSYPSFDQLPEFYQGLVKCTLDYGMLKKSLGAINWCKTKIDDFYLHYRKKIIKCADLDKINQYRREFYGRVSSSVKQIKEELKYLEQARKIMKEYPSLRDDVKTVVIIGFPNVGKTTLLYKLTGSKPEISGYPFTTKNINIGNIKGIQLLDTPGALNRINKMNNIEKQAYLAMKCLADIIIYIIDLTESYPLEDQIKLYEQIKNSGKRVIVYLSKSDLLMPELLNTFKKKYNAVTSVEELKEIL